MEALRNIVRGSWRPVGDVPQRSAYAACLPGPDGPDRPQPCQRIPPVLGPASAFLRAYLYRYHGGPRVSRALTPDGNRRSVMTKGLRVIWLLLPLMLAAGCASTTLSPIGAASPAFQREADEERLWESSKRFEALLAENRLLSQDAQLDAYLSNVAASLLPPEVSATGVTVRVRVVRNPIPNAFVLPNGTVYLHSRMLALMENEAQLSAIIGHELVHFINRHLVKERRDARNKAGIAKLVNTVLAEASYGLLAPLTGQLAEIWSLAAVRGYSRELETEADTLGFALVVRAGYDPAEVPKIFEALKRELPPGHAEGFFFATHPKLRSALIGPKRF